MGDAGADGGVESDGACVSGNGLEKVMKAAAIGSKQLIEEYIENLSSKPKTEELLDRYVDDPALKEHIRQTEAAYPGYSIDAEEMVAEGDVVAIRGTLQGVHKGAFAGVPSAEGR
jgi:predicted ester cyclase